MDVRCYVDGWQMENLDIVVVSHGIGSLPCHINVRSKQERACVHIVQRSRSDHRRRGQIDAVVAGTGEIGLPRARIEVGASLQLDVIALIVLRDEHKRKIIGRMP